MMSMKHAFASSIVAASAIAMAMPSLAQDAQGGHSMHMSQPAEAQTGMAGTSQMGHSASQMQDLGSAAPMRHQLHMVAGQHVLAHTATIHAALVALDIDRDANLHGLREARDSFAAVLAGLRHGDENLGLTGFEQPAIFEEMQRVEGIWALYDAIIQQSLEGSDVTDRHISALTGIDSELHRALTRLVEAAEYHSSRGRGFSILMPTISEANNLQVALQNLVAKYLLAAHGDAGAAADMAQAAADFEHLLAALTHGDSDLRVLPAPTSDIAAQYARIGVMWQECWSEVSGTSAAARADSANIERLRAHIADLSNEVTEVVDMYHYL